MRFFFIEIKYNFFFVIYELDGTWPYLRGHFFLRKIETIRLLLFNFIPSFIIIKQKKAEIILSFYFSYSLNYHIKSIEQAQTFLTQSLHLVQSNPCFRFFFFPLNSCFLSIYATKYPNMKYLNILCFFVGQVYSSKST